jgi:hypothetical protein
MTDTPQIRETLAWRIWIAIRFIVFGVGGFIALWISWLSLIFAFDPPSQRLFSPFVAVPLALVGALMMLYGGGQWGRWAYLWVFVSVPIVITLLGMLSGFISRWTSFSLSRCCWSEFHCQWLSAICS